MYVRHKFIKGHKYFYLVRGERHGDTVEQIHVRYLGKDPWAYVSPSRFTRTVRKDLNKLERLPFYKRHVKKVTCVTLAPGNSTKVRDQAHMFGHVIFQSLPSGGKRSALDRALEEHVLAETKYMGRYERR